MWYRLFIEQHPLRTHVPLCTYVHHFYVLVYMSITYSRRLDVEVTPSQAPGARVLISFYRTTACMYGMIPSMLAGTDVYMH